MPRSATAIRRRRRRPTAVALLAGLAAGATTLLGLAASPASAATKVDGTWTVAHAGTGQILFNPDSTYTSTCRTLTTFPLAHCPAPAGTFAFNGAYLTFTGTDGSTLSLRMSGSVLQPAALNEIQPNYNGLIVNRGATFTCSTFYDSTYAFAKGPVVTTNAQRTLAYALGSHQALGAVNAGNYVFLAETAPGYFVQGRCA